MRVVAGDGIELVERAAGMAEAAARDHRHEGAEGCEHRGEHQRNVVADAAGRVLVEHRARQVGRAPVDGRARERHRLGQRDPLGEAHAAEEHRHGEGRGLALGDVAAGQAADELGDLAGGKLAPVALGADDFLGKDHAGLRLVGADEAAQERLEPLGGEAGVFLGLLVARVAAGEARPEIGHDRDGGDGKARATGEDHFRHGRHADEVGAERLGGADFRRGLEARAGKPHVDALVELDARFPGDLAQGLDQARVVGAGQRHEPVGAGVADQRVRSREIDVVGDGDQRRRRPVELEAAGRVGDQQRLAAEALERVDRDAHGGRVAALVIVAAALEERDPLALDRADDEPPGMALDARDGKAGKLRIAELGRRPPLPRRMGRGQNRARCRAAAGCRGRAP